MAGTGGSGKDFYLSFGSDASDFAKEIKREIKDAAAGVSALQEALKEYDATLAARKSQQVDNPFKALGALNQELSRTLTKVSQDFSAVGDTFGGAISKMNELVTDVNALVRELDRVQNPKPTKRGGKVTAADVTDEDIQNKGGRPKNPEGLNTAATNKAIARLATLNATLLKNATTAGDAVKNVSAALRDMNASLKELDKDIPRKLGEGLKFDLSDAQITGIEKLFATINSLHIDPNAVKAAAAAPNVAAAAAAAPTGPEPVQAPRAIVTGRQAAEEMLALREKAAREKLVVAAEIRARASAGERGYTQKNAALQEREANETLQLIRQARERLANLPDAAFELVKSLQDAEQEIERTFSGGELGRADEALVKANLESGGSAVGPASKAQRAAEREAEFQERARRNLGLIPQDQTKLHAEVSRDLASDHKETRLAAARKLQAELIALKKKEIAVLQSSVSEDEKAAAQKVAQKTANAQNNPSNRGYAAAASKARKELAEIQKGRQFILDSLNDDLEKIKQETNRLIDEASGDGFGEKPGGNRGRVRLGPMSGRRFGLGGAIGPQREEALQGAEYRTGTRQAAKEAHYEDLLKEALAINPLMSNRGMPTQMANVLSRLDRLLVQDLTRRQNSGEELGEHDKMRLLGAESRIAYRAEYAAQKEAEKNLRQGGAEIFRTDPKMAPYMDKFRDLKSVAQGQFGNMDAATGQKVRTLIQSLEGRFRNFGDALQGEKERIIKAGAAEGRVVAAEVAEAEAFSTVLGKMTDKLTKLTEILSSSGLGSSLSAHMNPDGTVGRGVREDDPQYKARLAREREAALRSDRRVKDFNSKIGELEMGKRYVGGTDDDSLRHLARLGKKMGLESTGTQVLTPTPKDAAHISELRREIAALTRTQQRLREDPNAAAHYAKVMEAHLKRLEDRMTRNSKVGLTNEHLTPRWSAIRQDLEYLKTAGSEAMAGRLGGRARSREKELDKLTAPVDTFDISEAKLQHAIDLEVKARDELIATLRGETKSTKKADKAAEKNAKDNTDAGDAAKKGSKSTQNKAKAEDDLARIVEFEGKNYKRAANGKTFLRVTDEGRTVPVSKRTQYPLHQQLVEAFGEAATAAGGGSGGKGGGGKGKTGGAASGGGDDAAKSSSRKVSGSIQPVHIVDFSSASLGQLRTLLSGIKITSTAGAGKFDADYNTGLNQPRGYQKLATLRDNVLPDIKKLVADSLAAGPQGARNQTARMADIVKRVQAANVVGMRTEKQAFDLVTGAAKAFNKELTQAAQTQALIAALTDKTRTKLRDISELHKAGKLTDQQAVAQANLALKHDTNTERMTPRERKSIVGQTFALPPENLNAYLKAGQHAGDAFGDGLLAGMRRKMGLQNGETFVNRILGTAGNFLVRNISGSIVFGATQVLGDALRQGLETESTFIRVSAALDATGRSSDGLRTKLQGISTELGVSLEDVYLTAANLVGVFEHTDDAVFATRLVHQLQVVSGGALNTVEGFRALSAVTNAYGITGAAALEHVADVATAIQNNIGVNIEDTLEGVARLGPIAKQYQFTLEEIAVLTGLIGKGTGQTGQAASEQFGRILSRFQKGTGQKLLKGLKDKETGENLGVATDASFEDGGEGIGPVIKRFLANYEKISEGQKKAAAATFGAGREFASYTALVSGSANAAKLFEAATNSQGATQDRIAKLMQTINQQMKVFKSNIQNFATLIVRSGLLDGFGALLLAANKLFALVNEIGNKLVDAFQSNDVVGRIARITAGIIGLSVALRLVSKVAGPGFLLSNLVKSGAGFAGVPSVTTPGQPARLNGPLGLLTGGATALGTRIADRADARAQRAGAAVTAAGGATRNVGAAASVAINNELRKFGSGLATAGTSLTNLATSSRLAAAGAFALNSALLLAIPVLLLAHQGRQEKKLDAEAVLDTVGLRQRRKDEKTGADLNADVLEKVYGRAKNQSIARGFQNSIMDGDLWKNLATFKGSLRPGSLFDNVGEKFDPSEKFNTGFDKLADKSFGKSSKLAGLQVAGNKNPTFILQERLNEATERLKELDKAEEQLIKDAGKDPGARANAKQLTDTLRRGLTAIIDDAQLQLNGLSDVDKMSAQQLNDFQKLLGGLGGAGSASLRNFAPQIASLLQDSSLNEGSTAMKALQGALDGTASKFEREKARLTGLDAAIKASQIKLTDGSLATTEEIEAESTRLAGLITEYSTTVTNIAQTIASDASTISQALISAGNVKGAVDALQQGLNEINSAMQLYLKNGGKKTDVEYAAMQNTANQADKARRDALYSSTEAANTRAGGGLTDPVAQAQNNLAVALTEQKKRSRGTAYTPKEKAEADKAVADAQKGLADATRAQTDAVKQRNIAGIVDPVKRAEAELNETLRKAAEAKTRSRTEYEGLMAQAESQRQSLAAATAAQAAAQDQARIAGITDPVKKAQAELNAAIANAARTSHLGATQQAQNQAQITQARQNLKTAMDAEKAQFDQARAMLIIDPVKKAAADLTNALNAYARARGLSRGQDAINLAAVQNARQAYADALQAEDISKANVRIATASYKGDPVAVAAENMRIAARKLKDAKKTGNKTAINEAQAGVISAEAAVRDAKLQSTLDTIDFNVEMNKMTRSEAIKQLQELLKNKELTLQQRRDLERKIKGLQTEGQGQWNLGEIKLPTPYEVRKAIAGGFMETAAKDAGADMGMTGRALQASYNQSSSASNTTSNTQTVNITVNGNDLAAMKQVLAQYVGTAALQRSSVNGTKV